MSVSTLPLDLASMTEAELVKMYEACRQEYNSRHESLTLYIHEGSSGKYALEEYIRERLKNEDGEVPSLEVTWSGTPGYVGRTTVTVLKRDDILGKVRSLLKRSTKYAYALED